MTPDVLVLSNEIGTPNHRKRTGCDGLYRVDGDSISAFTGSSQGERNRRIDLVGIDFFRPSALDRLVEPPEQLGERRLPSPHIPRD